MKRIWMLGLGIFAAVAAPQAWSADPVWAAGKTEDTYAITVYRSASCGCCKGWIDHLKAHNFDVDDVVLEDVSAQKAKLGVAPNMASCHTAVVNGKVVEGHVPAQDIKAMLANHQGVQILTVPGMPSGGPGMDFPGAKKDAFTVYAVDADNNVSPFRTYTDY